ncbi:putative sperm motility kinase W [Rattus norvegicus]|uniref:non-specific serine/threonine protein kinase n=1 Tax=Rattus norvegicus TaxID=10116 RepID=A0A8I5ZR62_RAT|nr:putative sperm motility kinase W [Rattus norvegicus]XP_038936404.1 putative sperm motility kinase W [Rattus norvegicus]XP_038936406.1 putative sperm motility kinase W [Rattus norvegicus]XP_038936407.1 putative sperm motility kinase W [Rattus norvegicus]XP_038936408.1 putative sperm motility kinase W [Rattus norvegicus]XP_038936409.1 putative sperm motility kinase W [Rattus norvegicus]XP_038936410.1 putative sperm motility kinase W [Rattus norvegicus]XP_038936411.1 putative sperm motility |eukprot:XP_008763486.1 PREDICTED: putative sperm motility kinase W isoform X1 [Rattus norvegicus]
MASNPNKKTLRSQYRMAFLLGQGSFGNVKLAWHRKTQALVAIKSVEICKKTIRGILSEMTILESLHHPNIISLFQVLLTSSQIHFILQYVPGGNLVELIREEGPLPEEQAKKMFGQVVSALRYCHSRGIVHRDIKPQNILIDAAGNVKLIDFGVAIKCRPGTLLKTQCGTRGFCAPEIVLGEPYDGKKADVWSLGVLLFFLTTGYFPFRGGTTDQIKQKVTTGTYTIPTHLSGQLENLIHQILTVSPELRPSIEEIENHPWIKKCEVNIPPMTDPDYKIIEMLCGMGYNANDILESLQQKRYDEPMGAYLSLRNHVIEGYEIGSITPAKPGDQCPPPPPSPAHPSVFGLPLRRRASEPNFGLLHRQPSKEQNTVALTLSGLKMSRCVSMPPIAVYYPKKERSTSTLALHSTPVASPCVYNNMSGVEIILPHKEDIEVNTSSPPQTMGWFKRLRKGIRDCLSRLCCLPRAPKKKPQHRSSKRVAPLKKAASRTK